MLIRITAKIPRSSTTEDTENSAVKSEVEVPLPQTLVRIPIDEQSESAPNDQKGAEGEI